MTISARSAGRVFASLHFLQGIITPIVNFGLLGRASAPPGFLTNAAAHALGVRVAVLLWFVAGALTLAAAVVALPVFRQHSERLALLYLALATLGCATVTIENVTLLHMLAVSQEYAKASGTKEIFEALATTARSARLAAHYVNLLVGGITGFVMYLVLFRSRLAPRAITGAGLIAVSIQVIAVAMPLLGLPFQFSLLTPVALTQLALMLWLVTKGFEQRR